MRPFVDFYRANKISPVAQDISDTERHFGRRDALYRHLGLVPAWLRGRSVIEFGPGSGYNSLHTASLCPRRYVLVDGNPTGLDAARSLLKGFAATEFQFAGALVEDFDTDERFDLVICEGTIPFQLDPPAFLRAVARFAARGGIVITTCVDGVSLLAETLRRLAAALLTAPEQSTADKLAILLPVFSPHLATLKGMSRSHEDWILDQLIQPLVGRLFPIADAIAALDGDFDAHGSSPRFLVDWRWHKEIHGAAANYNGVALQSYYRNLHNLADYRFTSESRNPDANRRFLELCDKIYAASQRYWLTRDNQAVADVSFLLPQAMVALEVGAPLSAKALQDFVAVFEGWRKSGRMQAFGEFASWFGRGQQYLSLMRR
ncbi:MAG TPA: methyltransferase domain-containing protein [Candidatus Cybelea sp.]|nr:methyltransferase domain-containing protein [Candidatus Cybelea sp.]